MSKIQIELPKETNEKLKELAKADFRSLTNYITVALINLANNDGRFSFPNSSQSLTLSQLQEAGINSFKLQKPQITFTPEEEQLQQQQFQAKLDKLRTTRIDYFRKKYKEVYGEYPPEAFRPSTYDYFLLKYKSNQELDTLIDTFDEYSYSRVK